MDVVVQDAEGVLLEPGIVLSIRAGSSRRQGTLQAQLQKPLRFPVSVREAQPFRVDALRPVGSGEADISLRPDGWPGGVYSVPLTKEAAGEAASVYSVPLTKEAAGEAASAMSLDLRVTPAPKLCGRPRTQLRSASQEPAATKDADTVPMAAEVNKPQTVASAQAQRYLTDHNIMPVVQSLLEVLVRDQPGAPDEYIADFMGAIAQPTVTGLYKDVQQGDVEQDPDALARHLYPRYAAVFDQHDVTSSGRLPGALLQTALCELHPWLSARQAKALSASVADEGVPLALFCKLADEVGNGVATAALPPAGDCPQEEQPPQSVERPVEECVAQALLPADERPQQEQPPQSDEWPAEECVAQVRDQARCMLLSACCDGSLNEAMAMVLKEQAAATGAEVDSTAAIVTQPSKVELPPPLPAHKEPSEVSDASLKAMPMACVGEEERVRLRDALFSSLGSGRLEQVLDEIHYTKCDSKSGSKEPAGHHAPHALPQEAEEPRTTQSFSARLLARETLHQAVSSGSLEDAVTRVLAERAPQQVPTLATAAEKQPNAIANHTARSQTAPSQEPNVICNEGTQETAFVEQCRLKVRGIMQQSFASGRLEEALAQLRREAATRSSSPPEPVASQAEEVPVPGSVPAHSSQSAADLSAEAARLEWSRLHIRSVLGASFRNGSLNRALAEITGSAGTSPVLSVPQVANVSATGTSLSAQDSSDIHLQVCQKVAGCLSRSLDDGRLDEAFSELLRRRRETGNSGLEESSFNMQAAPSGASSLRSSRHRAKVDLINALKAGRLQTVVMKAVAHRPPQTVQPPVEAAQAPAAPGVQALKTLPPETKEPHEAEAAQAAAAPGVQALKTLAPETMETHEAPGVPERGCSPPCASTSAPPEHAEEEPSLSLPTASGATTKAILLLRQQALLEERRALMARLQADPPAPAAAPPQPAPTRPAAAPPTATTEAPSPAAAAAAAPAASVIAASSSSGATGFIPLPPKTPRPVGHSSRAAHQALCAKNARLNLELAELISREATVRCTSPHSAAATRSTAAASTAAPAAGGTSTTAASIDLGLQAAPANDPGSVPAGSQASTGHVPRMM